MFSIYTWKELGKKPKVWDNAQQYVENTIKKSKRTQRSENTYR